MKKTGNLSNVLMERIDGIKKNRLACILRQNEILERYEKIRNEIMKNTTFDSEAKYFESLMHKVKLLGIENFEAKSWYQTELGCLEIREHYSWLFLSDEYRKNYGEYFAGHYCFKLDEKMLAENLLNKDVVKKTVYLNVIGKKQECTWHDENPYFSTYNDFYHPIKIDLYCNKDFDENKKYSVEEIKKLIKNNQILVCNYSFDEDNKQEKNRHFDLNKLNGTFKIGKINYSKNDRTKILTEKQFDELKSTSITTENLQNLFSKNLEGIVYNQGSRIVEESSKNQVKSEKIIYKTLFDFNVNYPNFLKSLDETIKYSFEKEIKIETEKIEFIKEYSKYLLDKEVKEVKAEIAKINKTLNNEDFKTL